MSSLGDPLAWIVVFGLASASAANGGDALPVAPGAAGSGIEAPVATGVAAIRGENVAGSGANHGLVGISHSPSGSGLVARNETSGADLILDGEAQGQADTPERCRKGARDTPGPVLRKGARDFPGDFPGPVRPERCQGLFRTLPAPFRSPRGGPPARVG